MLTKFPTAAVTVSLQGSGDSLLKQIAKDMAGMTVKTGNLLWPNRCACCGTTTDVASLGLEAIHSTGSDLRSMQVPYCRRCMEHHEGSRSAGLWGFLVGMAGGGLLAILAMMVRDLYVAESSRDAFMGTYLLLWLVATVALSIRGWKKGRAKVMAALSPQCTGAESPAVFFVSSDGRECEFRFCSRPYAEHFAALNGGAEVKTLQFPQPS